jgi:hypothetical protein
MLIGARWIGFMTKVEEFEGHLCTRRHSDQRRTRDPDEATRLWRATIATTSVEVRLTSGARNCGNGIELAIALRERGVPVDFDSACAREDELTTWVDGTRLEDLPRPNLPPPDALSETRFA